jgi:hypothetical protein
MALWDNLVEPNLGLGRRGDMKFDLPAVGG